MDLQKALNAMMAEAREQRLSGSDQLLLGELKLKLQAVEDRNKPIVFDFGMKPAGACSWRGESGWWFVLAVGLLSTIQLRWK